MKFYRYIAAAICAASSLSAAAQASASPQRFSPLADGYLQRASIMREDGNFTGVIDQLMHLDVQQTPLSPDQEELYSFLLADAYYRRGDAQCVQLLQDFLDNWPASRFAPEAALAIADSYFFEHNWPDALEAYKNVDFSRLNHDDYLLYSYREGLAMIKTGHFREARTLINRLQDAPEYADAYNFYNAYLLYIDGRFNDAYKSFERVTPGIPGLEAGYYMTQIEYSRGEYQNVISHGRSLLRKNPVPELVPEINRIVGLSYFKTGDLDNARIYLQTYLESVDDSAAADALYALGAISYNDADYPAAIKYLSPLTELNDEIGQGAWLYLGQCYLKQDNNTSAAMAFEKASKLTYDAAVSESALYNYVTAVTRGGKVPFSSSSQLLERFVQLYPNSPHTPEVEAYLATAYYNDRNYTEALRIIDAIKRPSSDVLSLKQKVLYELGVDAVSNGRQNEAVDYLQKAVALQKQDPALAAQASLWLGDALFALNRFSEAAKSYQTFVSAGRNSQNYALGLYDLAYAKYKLENWSGAATDFEAALNARPALNAQLTNDATIRRADCLYYIGRYSDASSLFSRAIDSDAADTDYALYRRAILFGLSGNTSAKIKDIERIERDFPDSRWLSKALLDKAVTYEEMGRNDLAADAYKKRLNVTSDIDIDELLRMAETMHASRRWNDLLDVTTRIFRAGGLEPDEHAQMTLYRADALANTGSADEANDLYAGLAANPSSLPGSKAAVTLAESALAAKDYGRARDLMESFTETGTPHQYWLARGFIALADAYRGLGEKTLAKEYILSLRDNYPGTEADIEDMISSRLKKWK